VAHAYDFLRENNNADDRTVTIMNLKLDTYPEIGGIEQKSPGNLLGNDQGE